MSFATQYLSSDVSELLDPYNRVRGRHPLVSIEEAHTSRMMQPKYSHLIVLNPRFELTFAGQDGPVRKSRQEPNDCDV